MNSITGGDAAFVIDTTQLLLRRTASEESLSVMKDPRAHEANPVAAAMSARLARRRPAAHRKGRAPAPPGGSGSGQVVRSNSVTQARLDGKRTDWYRSRSTTRYEFLTTLLIPKRIPFWFPFPFLAFSHNLPLIP